MAIKLSGPDGLISNTANAIHRVGQELNAHESYENTLHAFQNPDNIVIKTWRQISSYFGKIGNSYRICNITVVNFGIFSIFGYLLVRLTSRYHKLYTKSSILATVATNVVLYGISDTCAQSITQFLARKRVSPMFNRPSGNRYSDGGIRITINNNSDVDLDESNIFIDYGNGEGESDYDRELGNDLETLPTTYCSNSEEINFNFKRWLGFISWGFIMAFIQVAWYMFLNAMFTDMPSIVSVLERDLTDQLLFSPISLASFFAFTTVVIEGGDLEDYKNKMYKLYITTYAVSFSVWFPVQFINFSIMPKKFQVPFSSSVGVIWNCFLSYRNAASSSSK